MSEALPAGHERRTVGSTEIVAHGDVADDLTHAVEQCGTLYAWAAERPQPVALRGRAPVYVATLPDSNETVAVRHAWHGGLLAPLTSDRWLRPSRAGIELRKSLSLQQAGIQTAPVLGYALYAAGPGLVRVDVVSRFLDNSWDLGAVLSNLAPGIALEEALEATRILLVQLAAHRLQHPDLNVKNILLRRSGGALVAVVIDVDVMQHLSSSTPEAVMHANAERFLRSVAKWQRQTGDNIDLTAQEGLRESLLHSVPSAEQVSLPGFER